ncbi:MAG: hypothetical protein P8017_01455 [Deltaproteobacteria bacterium]
MQYNYKQQHGDSSKDLLVRDFIVKNLLEELQLRIKAEGMSRSFPKDILETQATGKLLHNGHDSRHQLAGFLLSEHHIFMLALAKRRE